MPVAPSLVPPQVPDRQAGHSRAYEHAPPLGRRLFASRHRRRPHHARHPVGEQQHHPGRGPAQARPQPVGRQLPRRGAPRQVPRHARPGVLPGPVQPPLHRARAERTARGLPWRRLQRAPELPALLVPQPRPQHGRRAPHRRAQMLPVVDGAAVHLPRVPTAPHQQRRLLRIRAPTRMAPVALDPHRLPPQEGPRMPPVAAPLARPALATLRTAAPLPRAPRREFPQPLEEGLAPLDNVHGHCHPGRFSTSYGGSCPPSALPSPTNTV
jgi:hypothetical protein